MGKMNFISLQNEELSAKEKSLTKGGFSSVTCSVTNCSAADANTMANQVLSNLRGVNTPAPPPMEPLPEFK